MSYLARIRGFFQRVVYVFRPQKITVTILLDGKAIAEAIVPHLVVPYVVDDGGAELNAMYNDAMAEATYKDRN